MAVRNEVVRLSLDDDFTSGMARAALATHALGNELDSLSGNAVRSSRATQSVNKEVDHLGDSTAEVGRGHRQVLRSAAADR